MYAPIRYYNKSSIIQQYSLKDPIAKTSDDPWPQTLPACILWFPLARCSVRRLNHPPWCLRCHRHTATWRKIIILSVESYKGFSSGYGEVQVSSMANSDLAFCDVYDTQLPPYSSSVWWNGDTHIPSAVFKVPRGFAAVYYCTSSHPPSVHFMCANVKFQFIYGLYCGFYWSRIETEDLWGLKVFTALTIMFNWVLQV